MAQPTDALCPCVNAGERGPMFMARIYSATGRLLYQSPAASPSREEAARAALDQRPKAKGVSTSRAAMVGGEWRDLHSDIRYHPRHAVARGDLP
jgi:hypothetical protein